jgi:iron complex outermembrane receptor protein/vitamin B12 transporter
MVRRIALVWLLLVAADARAVIVRGRVTTQLGVPLAAARVQLIRLDGGTRSVSDTISGVDGAYEIRSGYSGRFLLLTSPSFLQQGIAPQIGSPFYGGRTDVVSIDIALNTSTITPQVTDLVTLIDAPLRQLSAAPLQVAADQLLTQATPLPELRPLPGVFVVQLGQVGMPATLYLRGAPVTQTLIDGASAEDLGGAFNLASLTSSGLAALASSPAMELGRNANALHFLDSGAGTLSLTSPTASTLRPTLTYVGDAGNLSTVRNEAIVSLAHTRSDVLGSFSRLNTDNDLPAARLHLITSVANLGYHVSAMTSLRLMLRYDVDGTPLAIPFGFYNIQPSGEMKAQNLYSGFTFDTTSVSGWHNLLRYGLARKRSEDYDFSTAVAGLPVTITGANGYTVSGVASFPVTPAREDLVTNRDEISYQTDYRVKDYFRPLLTARYEDERGADILPGSGLLGDKVAVERHQFSLAGGIDGDIKHRFFYQAAGFFDTGTLVGVRGAPSLGLTYAPVRPGVRRFRGTILHVTAAAGVREPSLAEQLDAPGGPLKNSAGVGPSAPRSRTFDVSIDQDIVARKLSLRTAYFHNQFAHEAETLGLAPLVVSDTLGYRTQGLETELRYQPFSRLRVQSGYTYLASLVEQSVSTAVFNPAFPGVPIGELTALVGARPFRRPPNTGFLTAEYSGQKLAASIKASFAGSSDDSTNLYLNKNLLLPDRNLSPGYGSVDAGVSYKVMRHITVYSQFTNLLNERTIAPIGYLSTPFGVRVGLRVRLGRE